jgi:hypothetical protein
MMMASPQGQTPEGKSMIEQIMSAVAGAADIVKTLVPPQAPPAARITHQSAPVAAVTAPEPAAAAAAPATTTPAPGKNQAEWDAMTPEQRAAIQAQAPTGANAVIQSIYAIQKQRYSTQTEYQQLIQYLVTEMPLDLRVAVLNGDEASIFALMAPIVTTTPELATWIIQPGVADWIRTFVAQLPPSLEGVFGPAQAQRDQLATALAAQAAQQGAPVPTGEAAPATTEPAPTGEAAPVAEVVPVVDLTSGAAVEQAPEAAVPSAPVADTAAAAESHLSNDPDAP